VRSATRRGCTPKLGVLVLDEPQVLADLEQQFEAIWEAATSIEPDTIGIAMDFPTVRAFSFVAIRDVGLGEYATAEVASPFNEDA
jgi:hypothetical protein